MVSMGDVTMGPTFWSVDPSRDSPTNHTTAWFRSPKMWNHLRDVISTRRRCDAWSGACSIGEEAWSMAALLHDLKIPGTVLATDASADAVDVAQAGVYGRGRIDPQVRSNTAYASLITKSVRSIEPNRYSIRRHLRNRVEFGQADLRAIAPPSVDIALVGNVWRFLARSEQLDLMAEIHSSLAADGRLVLGPTDLIDPELRETHPSGLHEYFERAEYMLIFRPRETAR